MVGKKISELQALTEITGQEMIPVAVGGQNYSVLSSLLQSGDATKLNDYMYDVSQLMGKMAVRGTKGTSKTTQPYGPGYYHVDGSYTELGSQPAVITVIVDENKVYHSILDIINTRTSLMTRPFWFCSARIIKF